MGYFACHQWLQKRYPLVGKCDLCGKEKRTEFVYKGCPGGWKRDRDAYHEACHSCNRLLDNYLRENLSAVG